MPEFIKNIITDVKASVVRFMYPFALTVALFSLASYMVIAEPGGAIEEIVFRLILTASFALLVCTLGIILLEQYGEALGLVLPFARPALLLLGAAGYPLFKGFGDDPYVTAGYVGVLFTLFVLVVFFSTKTEISASFSYILKNTVFNWLACGIVNGGVALSIFAFSSLIYEIEELYKVMSVSSFFIWIILFINLSLSAIPHKGRALTIPRLFKIIVMYVAAPVYLLLVAILCVYLGKVLVTFTFPSGKINWFASFASLFFVFFVFTLRQYRHENRFAALFVKYGGAVLLPIIAVQFMAIYIRLSNYGLTSLRYVSVVLNVIAFVFAAVSLIKDGKFIKYMLLVLAAAALALTLTPLNLFDVPARDQAARLERVLVRNGMLNDGKITPKADISKEDQLAISSAWRYLEYSHDGTKPAIMRSIAEEKKNFHETFGFAAQYENDFNGETAPRLEYISYYTDYKELDINSFSKLYMISNLDNGAKFSSSFFVKGTEIPFDFLAEARRLHGLYGANAEDVPMVYDLPDGQLILTSFGFVYENSAYAINFYSGYFLEH